MQRISAIVITRNAAADIVACLQSVAFCDERIVVDCGSDDDTVRLAENAGARVVQHAWEGFGPQKNFALSLAAAEWVLSIDADERVPPELAAEIAAATETAKADGYAMPRLTYFCGRPLHRSGAYPDFVLRLFRRGRARFSDHLVHEHVVCQGRTERLTHNLLHYSLPTLTEARIKADRYATAGAEAIVQSGRRVWFASGVLHGAAAFLRTYVLQRGFLDGREGFLFAVYKAEASFYKFMKAWEATRKR